MGLISSSAVLDLLLLLLFLISMAHCEQPGVLYNNRSLIINGQKKILISGSIHYPRSTPNMWPDLIAKAKAGGLNVIDTYVFWNGHEPEEGKYNFEERYDLVKFIKLVKNASLYVNLRIGPYVCAEWNFGGFPVWLKFVPGISFRTNNEPFKSAMEKFTKKIVKMMKDESLFESQGGPIILSQIENEYGPLEGELGDAGKLYTKWAAEMALSLETRVPWIMCKQEDAPFPIIDTCNGFYCDLFKPNDTRKPKMWTEVWTGWFTAFGGGVPSRPAEDLAFAVALFIANGGSFLNYYMYHGGTNFGRTAGGPFIATSYDYDAPLDEYGLLRQPKWGHLKNLHAAIKQSEPALLSGDPIITNLGIKGDHQQAYVYGSGKKKCAAFLKNYNQHSAVNVTFWNKQYTLPPWSVSILPDCKKVVYNTAEVASKEYYSESEKPRMKRVEGGFEWESYSEAVGSTNDSCSFTAKGLLDQLNTTWDKTDYLWYMIRVNIGSGKGHYNIGNNSTLRVLSAGDALYAYVNGMLLGTAYGSIDHAKFDYSAQVPSLRDGVNEISLLSVAVGLQNIGKFFETWPLGINHVSLGGKNLRMLNWTYKVGMEGEHQWIYSENGSNSVPWVKGDQLANKKPLTWYKTWFNEPSGDEPLALDMDTMSKGQIWVNGNNIGRYWISNKATGKCTGSCNYAGLYREDKCLSRCGKASQHMYQVPRYWLKSNGNFLVVFEEWGGDPHGIKLVKRVCGISVKVLHRIYTTTTTTTHILTIIYTAIIGFLNNIVNKHSFINKNNKAVFNLSIGTLL